MYSMDANNQGVLLLYFFYGILLILEVVKFYFIVFWKSPIVFVLILELYLDHNVTMGCLQPQPLLKLLTTDFTACC